MSFLKAHSVRIALGALAFLGVVLAPPWVPLFAMALLALRYPAWEVLFIGLFADLVWLAPLGGGAVSFPLFTVAALVLVWGFEPLRRMFLLEERGFL